MTPEDFIRDYTNGCSNELSVTKYTDGKEVIEYHEWVSPEVALGAVQLAREEIKAVLLKTKELADAMYYAAHQMSTDASYLHKAMEAWWHFKNYELNKHVL